MNDIDLPFINANSMFILAATYGDGQALKTVSKFIEKLTNISRSSNLEVALLGFSDRKFTEYCEFVKQIETELT